MIMIEQSACRGQERIVFIWPIMGSLPFAWSEMTFSVRSGKSGCVENRRSRMVCLRTGPGKGSLVQALEIYSAITWSAFCYRVNYFGSICKVPFRAKSTSQVSDDFPVCTCFPWCFDGFADPLYSPCSVGKCSVLFSPACCRKYYICELGGFCQENILDNKKIKVFKAMSHMGCIRIGNHWILSHNVKSFNISFSCCLHHFHYSQTRLSRDLCIVPESFHLFPDCCVSHFLVSSYNVRQTAHVTGSLDIVLSTKGIDTCTWTSDHTAKHSQVSQCPYVVSTRSVLGYSHCVIDCGIRSISIGFCSFLDEFCRNSRNSGNLFRCVRSASSILRGSQTISFVPFLACSLNQEPITGWVSVLFEPITKRTSASFIDL